MKKLSVFLAIWIVLMSFVGCGNRNVKIEDHTWQLLYVHKSDENDILYASPAYLKAFAYVEGVEELDLVCTAADGKFVLTDNATGQVYEGSYEETGRDRMFMSKDKDTGYGLILGETPGIATAYNEYPVKGAEVGAIKDRHALFIMVDGYSLTFLAEGVFEADFPAE